MSEVAVPTSGEEPPRIRLRKTGNGASSMSCLRPSSLCCSCSPGRWYLLDSAPGHRFIVDRIGELQTSTGLKFRIGRIDGSLFGKAKIRQLAVSDQQGVFLTAPLVTVDWTPGAWLRNRLWIDSLTAERVDLIRLPRTKPSTKKGPILPGFDIGTR